jgi:hypothetical protein
MRLRATLRVRNDVMIAAREARDMSQGDLAKAARVPPWIVQKLEALQYRGSKTEEYAMRLASFLLVPLEQIYPGDVRFQDRDLPSTQVVVTEVPLDQLLPRDQQRLAIAGPDDLGDKILVRNKILQVLGTLKEREAGVLRQRFGLDGSEKSYEEVSQAFRISTERVRLIENKALRRLRAPARSRQLRGLLPEQYHREIEEQRRRRQCIAQYTREVRQKDKRREARKSLAEGRPVRTSHPITVCKNGDVRFYDVYKQSWKRTIAKRVPDVNLATFAPEEQELVKRQRRQ